MLAQTPAQDKPTLKESVELYVGGHWLAAYPYPLDWGMANNIALTWKRNGYTTLIEEAVGGWMVYILGGAK